MSKSRMALIVVLILAAVLTGLVFLPNPASEYIGSQAKAAGYVEYDPLEAYDLAKGICTQCHELTRIKQYCPRCGPPFIAVIPHMQTFIENYRKTKPGVQLRNVTKAQAVAIVQVWNALVGNWEGDYREKDLIKLIGQYDFLVKLLKTPVDQRKIEHALMVRDDLKIGHMFGKGVMADKEKEMQMYNQGMKNPQAGPAESEKPLVEDMGTHDHHGDHN